MYKSHIKDNKSKPPARVENKERRVNLKCKRKRNFFKKAIELSCMCDMDVLVILKDRDSGRFQQYSSGADSATRFTVERALQGIEAHLAQKRKVTKYEDEDYGRFKLKYGLEKDDLDDTTNNLSGQSKKRKAANESSTKSSFDEQEEFIQK